MLVVAEVLILVIQAHQDHLQVVLAEMAAVDLLLLPLGQQLLLLEPTI
jgi:hypothetical protein